MAELSLSWAHSKVTLKDILRHYGQPISEEKAWALCYQCCCKLGKLVWEFMHVPVLRGVEDIVMHHDGTISFLTHSGAWENYQSEKKIIENIGQVIYTALDWGLSSDLERTLSEPLDNLMHQMLGLPTIPIDTGMPLMDITLKDIIQVCAARLFTPSDASSHYQAVCKVYFAEYKDFCKLLHTIERSTKCLKQLESEDHLERDSLVLSKNWGNLWSNIIEELRLGVRLSKVEERKYQQLPLEYNFTPYERLMNDIRNKRYTLRKVKHIGNEGSPVSLGKRKDNRRNQLCRSKEHFIMNFINFQPLRPASARKLKERSQEDPSLHEMLMTEIKSAKKLQTTFPRVKPSVRDDDDSGTPCSLPSTRSEDAIPVLDYPVRRCRRRLQTIDQMDVGESSWHSEYSSESSSDRKFSDLTSSITDLMFVPVLTSSQVDLKTGSSMNDRMKCLGHRRSRSYESSMQRKNYGLSCQYRSFLPPPAIAELVPTRREAIKAEVVDFMQTNGCPAFSDSRVCFSCQKRRLFFTWPYICKICERVICLDCSVEMLMPFKQCMYLPVSFFKTLRLNYTDDPACKMHKQMFYQEVRHWDCSRVPLVFEHQGVAEESPLHKRTMKNWASMDICVKCEDYILEMVDMSNLCEAPSDGRRLWSSSDCVSTKSPKSGIYWD